MSHRHWRTNPHAGEFKQSQIKVNSQRSMFILRNFYYNSKILQINLSLIVVSSLKSNFQEEAEDEDSQRGKLRDRLVLSRVQKGFTCVP